MPDQGDAADLPRHEDAAHAGLELFCQHGDIGTSRDVAQADFDRADWARLLALGVADAPRAVDDLGDPVDELDDVVFGTSRDAASAADAKRRLDQRELSDRLVRAALARLTQPLFRQPGVLLVDLALPDPYDQESQAENAARAEDEWPVHRDGPRVTEMRQGR